MLNRSIKLYTALTPGALKCRAGYGTYRTRAM